MFWRKKVDERISAAIELMECDPDGWGITTTVNNEYVIHEGSGTVFHTPHRGEVEWYLERPTYRLTKHESRIFSLAVMKLVAARIRKACG